MPVLEAMLHQFPLRLRSKINCVDAVLEKTEPPIRTDQDPLKNQTLQGLSKHRLHGGEGTWFLRGC